MPGVHDRDDAAPAASPPARASGPGPATGLAHEGRPAPPLDRLVVPGILEMVPFEARPGDALHEIHTGEHAGDDLFAEIAAWEDLHTFVVVEDLTLAQRLQHYPDFANTWRALAVTAAGSAAPLEHGRLGEATLLLLDDARRPADDVGAALGRSLGVRFIEIGYTPQARGRFYFHFRIVKDGESVRRISGEYRALRAACLPAPNEDALAGEDRSRMLGRLVDLASDGLASSRAIALAFELGSHARRRGRASPPDGTAVVADDARPRARAIERALATAREAGAATADIAPYGTARRVRLPGFVLPPIAKSKVRGAPVVALDDGRGLDVPDEDVWVVAGLASPTLRTLASSPPPRSRPLRGGWWNRPAIGVLAALVIAASIALLALRFRKLPQGEACMSPRKCATGMCIIPFGDARGYCSRRCTADAECASGLTCRTVPGSRLCMLPDTPAH